MFTKTFIAVALVIPALALSSPAFAGGTYQGGPKSGLWTSSPTVETNKPYAEVVSPTSNRHIYQGGPKSTIPHGR